MMHWSHIVLLLALLLMVGGIFVSCGGSVEGAAEWHFDQGYNLAEQGRYK